MTPSATLCSLRQHEMLLCLPCSLLCSALEWACRPSPLIMMCCHVYKPCYHARSPQLLNNNRALFEPRELKFSSRIPK
uniref:Putative secreted protein n=1 Tax=Anopheles darlingi TaxID=43151 RepID=A0A2M4D0D0_ANODA